MSKTIIQLPAASALTGEEQIWAVQGEQDVKLPLSDLPISTPTQAALNDEQDAREAVASDMLARTSDVTVNVARSGGAIDPLALTFKPRLFKRTVEWGDANFPIFAEEFRGAAQQSFSAGELQTDAVSGAFSQGRWTIPGTGARHQIGVSLLGLVGPFFFVSLTVNTCTERVGCGVVTGAPGTTGGTYQAVANYDAGNVYLWGSDASGGATVGSTGFSPSGASFDLGLAVFGRTKLLLTRDVGGDWVVRCCQQDGKGDLRQTAFLDSARPYILAVGSAACTVSNFSVRLAGGVGDANFAPITYKDGTPLQRGNKVYFCGSRSGYTTSAGQSACIQVSYFSVFEMDVASLQIRNTAKLFFQRVSDGVVFGENSGCVIWDNDTQDFVLFVPTWGRALEGTYGVFVVVYRTKENILSGVHRLLDAGSQQLNLGVNSVYDPDVRWINGQWVMVGSLTNSPTLTAWIPHLAIWTSPDLVTWTNIFTASGVTTEGNKIVKIGGTYYAATAKTHSQGGVYNSTAFDFYSLTGAYVGEAVTTLNTFDMAAAHPCFFLVPHLGQTRVLLVAFDGARFKGMQFSEGNIVVMEADQTQVGYENPRKFPLALM